MCFHFFQGFNQFYKINIFLFSNNIMRREQGSRQFLMPRGKRILKHMIGGAFQRPYRHILPIAVNGRSQLAEQIGVRGSGADLLLSDTSISAANRTMGTGFGVKPPSTNLLRKLDNLNVGNIKKARKNVNIDL